jgi:hypothetical protein
MHRLASRSKLLAKSQQRGFASVPTSAKVVRFARLGDPKQVLK